MTRLPPASRNHKRTTLWLIGAMLLSVVFAGCQTSVTPTLPAATLIYDQPQPAPDTPTPLPTDTPLPPTVTPVPPTPVPDTPTPEPQFEPVSLTILHLNDVLGEVDPCG